MLAVYREMFGQCWENLIVVVTGMDCSLEEYETPEEYEHALN